jgi:hypothetical protein
MPLIPERLLRRIGQRVRTTYKFNRQGAKDAKKCNKSLCLLLGGLGVLGGLLALLGVLCAWSAFEAVVGRY